MFLEEKHEAIRQDNGVPNIARNGNFEIESPTRNQVKTITHNYTCNFKNSSCVFLCDCHYNPKIWHYKEQLTNMSFTQTHMHPRIQGNNFMCCITIHYYQEMKTASDHIQVSGYTNQRLYTLWSEANIILLLFGMRHVTVYWIRSRDRCNDVICLLFVP